MHFNVSSSLINTNNREITHTTVKPRSYRSPHNNNNNDGGVRASFTYVCSFHTQFTALFLFIFHIFVRFTPSGNGV